MINYGFAQLFDIKNLVKVTLAPHVWNRIRQIGINSRRRGVRARRKFHESQVQTDQNQQNPGLTPNPLLSSCLELLMLCH